MVDSLDMRLVYHSTTHTLKICRHIVYPKWVSNTCVLCLSRRIH